MAEAVLGLGTNLGEREAALARAADLLSDTPGIVIGDVSRIHRSAPWGVADQPDFLNLCMRIETSLTPMELLGACKTVEARLGRQARRRWGPREIDVDILLMCGVELDTDRLTIPHPRIAQRRFVVEPLSEVVPGWTLGTGTVGSLAATLRETASDQTCVPDDVATGRFRSLRVA